MTTPWNSLFSFSRFWPATCVCLFISATSSSRDLMSAPSCATLLWRASSSASFCCSEWVLSCVSSFVFCSSSTHQSFCSTSAACCFFRSAFISSMAFFTFSKLSNFMVKAKVVRRESNFLPAAANTAAARSWRLSWEDTCKKEKVLPKTSCASSAVKTSMVLLTAACSSDRNLLRLSYSVSMTAHFSLTSVLTAPSASKAAVVSLMSCLLCSFSKSADAFCSFLASNCFLPA
mmetsp:Transcript_10230/g.21322  ORF Transcript_10230/g.21322 Transcript_10230/m.21322 type:complete len:232 (-) Transcript_10230:477-1172(-)